MDEVPTLLKLPRQLPCYKVVGTEQTCRDYIAKRSSRNANDWAGFYLQLGAAHSLGTLGYRWDQGYESANLLEGQIEEGTPCWIFRDACWASGDISGEEKARRIKQALGIPSSSLLLEELGRRGEILLLRETLSQWELVLPLDILEKGVVTQERVIASFRPQKGLPITGFRRGEADKEWLPFQDHEAETLFPPQEFDVEALLHIR